MRPSIRLSASTRQLRAQLRTPTAFRLPDRHIVHFRQGNAIDLQGSTVRLPLEGPELLGLQRSEVLKDSELNTVYEQLVGAAMEAGYSENILNDRLEVLDFVRRDIIGSKGRARENRQLGLPVDLLPGALALMTEVGHCDLALDIGSELLRTAASPDSPLTPALRRDVMLSMALASCGLAREALEGGEGGQQQLGQGCAHLEAALQQLDAAGEPPLAPGLAAEIRQGLATLKFQGALEQLRGPLGPATAETRKRALRVIRDAIRSQSQQGSPSLQHPPQQETRGPLRGLGSLSLAVGTVRAAVGAQGGLGVGAVAGAAGAGAGAGSAGAAGAAGAQVVTAESMEALMGVLTCEEVVHLMEWEQVAASNAAGHKWVYPGLLEAVGVAHIVHGFVFRQPAYIKMGLGIVQQLPSTPDLCVVEGVCHVLLGAVSQAAEALRQAERPGKGAAADRSAPSDIDLARGASLPASRDAYRFVVAGSAGSDDGLLPGLCMLTERWLTQAAFPFFRDTSSPDMAPASLVKYFDDTRVETLLTVYDAKSGGQLAETLSEAFHSIRRGLRKAAAAGLLATGAAAAGDGTGAGDDLALAERQRLFRLVAGGVAALAALGAALLSPPGQRLLGRGDGAQAALVASTSGPQTLTPGVLQPLTVAPEDFTPAVARSLLERWQLAKAWALGPQHATQQLEVLLAEPLLSETLDKVATLRSHGAHMRFKLIRLEVLGVKRVSSKAGPAVRVSALVEDSADLHNDADGKPVNTCRRVYDAEYTVAQGRDGVWRMTHTSVVERESAK